jgi:hypothetical protein
VPVKKTKTQIAVVQHITDACSCPFYVPGEDGNHFCFIKNSVSLADAKNLVSEDRDISVDDWGYDCAGEWDNCNVLPLLYDYESGDIDPNAKDIADSYNPFEEDEEDDSDYRTLSSFTPPVIAEKEAQERANDEQEGYTSETLVYASEATFSIHQVEDPYRVKCDAILIPVNNLLEPMDLMLTRHAGAYFEKNRHTQSNIATGEVYPIKSPHPSISAREVVYRGVVAGVQSINVIEIEDAVRKTLHMAENSGVSTLAMMPMDYGGYDIELTAQSQISTIHEFLVSTHTKNLKHIVILIPDDMTMDVFEEYQKRIFNIQD